MMMVEEMMMMKEIKRINQCDDKKNLIKKWFLT